MVHVISGNSGCKLLLTIGDSDSDVTESTEAWAAVGGARNPSIELSQSTTLFWGKAIYFQTAKFLRFPNGPNPCPKSLAMRIWHADPKYCFLCSSRNCNPNYNEVSFCFNPPLAFAVIRVVFKNKPDTDTAQAVNASSSVEMTS